jgi:hypothetical protein
VTQNFTERLNHDLPIAGSEMGYHTPQGLMTDEYGLTICI